MNSPILHNYLLGARWYAIDPANQAAAKADGICTWEDGDSRWLCGKNAVAEWQLQQPTGAIWAWFSCPLHHSVDMGALPVGNAWWEPMPSPFAVDKTAAHPCICQMDTLMRNGCSCGGV